jgi:phospholipid/cholesterol/gamma-HCH transport system permease protein
MRFPLNILAFIGQIALHFLTYLGQLAELAKELCIALRSGVWRLRLVAQQIVAIGYGSQGVVIVTGAFTGAVFTFQSYAKFKEFGMETTVGAVVSVALCRELGPVLAGLMVAGRVGAAMAADIGTMKVTEQVDALRVMGVHPVDYLVLPRFLAMMFSMPFLVAESVSFGLFASYLVTSVGYDMPSTWYMTHMVDHTNMEDLSIGMIKGFVFGMLITLISCHQARVSRPKTAPWVSGPEPRARWSFHPSFCSS